MPDSFLPEVAEIPEVGWLLSLLRWPARDAARSRADPDARFAHVVALGAADPVLTGEARSHPVVDVDATLAVTSAEPTRARRSKGIRDLRSTVKVVEDDGWRPHAASSRTPSSMFARTTASTSSGGTEFPMSFTLSALVFASLRS